MGFYRDGELPVFHKLAKAYTICDRWFSSMPGPTWPNRVFVHTGTSLGYVTNSIGNQWGQTTLYECWIPHGYHGKYTLAASAIFPKHRSYTTPHGLMT